jgi:quinol monooxygenase YgiN
VIIVAGHIRVSAESRNIFLEGSAEAVRLAREEPDCLDFSVSADCVDEERVNVFERWQNRSALMSFRGEGPTDEQSAQIISAEVIEFEVESLWRDPAIDDPGSERM